MNRKKELVDEHGRREEYNVKKVEAELQKLVYGLDEQHVKVSEVVDKVDQMTSDGMTLEGLNNLIAETCAYMNILHPDYGILGARVAVSHLHRHTHSSFYQTMLELYNYVDNKTSMNASLIQQDVMQLVQQHRQLIEDTIDYTKDFNYDFFGYKTLEKSYLLKVNGKIVERPQDLLMRVSLGIHKEDIESGLETYRLMSEKWFTHATPTLFNSGTRNPQMSSCFLLHMKDDSIDGIYDTLKRCALISKSAGGIGLSVHNIRANGTYIKGTNGQSNGIVPMLRVFNNTARYVDQGGGKRKGSFAIYLEPWHADIFDFLELKKNFGSEEHRARDLFYALWVPDLFMQRVEQDAHWTLMCPHQCPGLQEVYGQAFEQLYTQYEAEGRGNKVVKARTLFQEIVDSQIETGTPYMLYKDAANSKCNQNNLGTIKSSNLCTEIMEYTSDKEVAVCNLASISLPMFVKEDNTFDYQQLMKVTKTVTRNLNKVIDQNYYPIPEAKLSNMQHRPIGIGVQGLADTFLKMGIAYEDDQALAINEQIFECIYYAACDASIDLAIQHGYYSSYPGSPASCNQLQFDLWKVQPKYCDWGPLKLRLKQHGMRNSLLVAPMPTASTSQIMGNNESFEPFTSNIYTRRTISGEFVCVNKYLVKDLIKEGKWDNQMRQQIMASKGSVQGIPGIPARMQQVYKTVWEISQRRIIDLAVNRAPFIDQSQSLNIHLAEATLAKMSTMHFYAWKKGLKTGMYYLRTRPAADAIAFTVDQQALLQNHNTQLNEVDHQPQKKVKKESKFKQPAQDEECLACGS